METGGYRNGEWAEPRVAVGGRAMPNFEFAGAGRPGIRTHGLSGGGGGGDDRPGVYEGESVGLGHGGVGDLALADVDATEQGGLALGRFGG